MGTAADALERHLEQLERLKAMTGRLRAEAAAERELEQARANIVRWEEEIVLDEMREGCVVVAATFPRPAGRFRKFYIGAGVRKWATMETSLLALWEVTQHKHENYIEHLYGDDYPVEVERSIQRIWNAKKH